MNPIIEIKLLHSDAKKPEYATDGAAGMDLYYHQAHTRMMIQLLPGDRSAFSTGIALGIPKGWEGQIRPRSGLAINSGITVLNTPGTIDSDYRGEIKVILINHSAKPVSIAHGDRIAQIVFAPVARAELKEVKEFSVQTARGEGGFGSTGINKELAAGLYGVKFAEPK